MLGFVPSELQPDDDAEVRGGANGRRGTETEVRQLPSSGPESIQLALPKHTRLSNKKRVSCFHLRSAGVSRTMTTRVLLSQLLRQVLSMIFSSNIAISPFHRSRLYLAQGEANKLERTCRGVWADRLQPSKCFFNGM